MYIVCVNIDTYLYECGCEWLCMSLIKGANQSLKLYTHGSITDMVPDSVLLLIKPCNSGIVIAWFRLSFADMRENLASISVDE